MFSRASVRRLIQYMEAHISGPVYVFKVMMMVRNRYCFGYTLRHHNKNMEPYISGPVYMLKVTVMV